MRAAVIAAPGESPTYATFADPAEQEGREVVEVVAAGIHPLVRSTAAGQHYSSLGGAWPRIPGVDAVARTAEGGLVYTGWPQPPFGTLAEHVSVPQHGFPVPDGADPVALAGGVNPGIATWFPLYQAGFVDTADRPARELGSVVIIGATGASGTLAVQNAWLLGARRIVAVGRNPETLDATTELGATHTVRLSGELEADATTLADAIGEAAPDIVLDLVWGTAAETAFAALLKGRAGENESTYVHIGSMGGRTAQVPGALLRSRPISLLGSGVGSVPMSVLRSEIPRYIDLIATGRVVPRVVEYPLAEIEVAWERAGSSAARVVVAP